MNKDERREFKEAWLEAENLITLIDPHFKELGGVIHMPEVPTVGDLKRLLQFLRVEIRALLLDRESLEREKIGLRNYIDTHGSEDIGEMADD